MIPKRTLDSILRQAAAWHRENAILSYQPKIKYYQQIEALMPTQVNHGTIFDAPDK